MLTVDPLPRSQDFSNSLSSSWFTYQSPSPSNVSLPKSKQALENLPPFLKPFLFIATWSFVKGKKALGEKTKWAH